MTDIREALQELVECFDADPIRSEAWEKSGYRWYDAWTAARAALREDRGSLLREPTKPPEPDARELWVKRLAEQYGARQAATLRGDGAAVDTANHWIGIIARDSVFEILQAVRAAPIPEDRPCTCGKPRVSFHERGCAALVPEKKL